MTTPPESDVAITSLVVIPKEPAQHKGCIVTRLDVHLLEEGSGAGRHSAMRDVTGSICVTAIVGVLGLLGALPDVSQITTIGKIAFVGMLSAAIGTGVLAGWFHYQAAREKDRPAYRECLDRIWTALGGKKE